MKKVLLLAIGMVFLVGCSSTGVTVTNPVKIGNSTVQIPSMTQPVMDAIDAACTDVLEGGPTPMFDLFEEQPLY